MAIFIGCTEKKPLFFSPNNVLDHISTNDCPYTTFLSTGKLPPCINFARVIPWCISMFGVQYLQQI